LLIAAYQKSYYVREKSPSLKIKEDIVGYAKYTWPLLFSRFYEAFRLDGPPLPKNDVSYQFKNLVESIGQEAVLRATLIFLLLQRFFQVYNLPVESAKSSSLTLIRQMKE
jgi:hypothetical protein